MQQVASPAASIVALVMAGLISLIAGRAVAAPDQFPLGESRSGAVCQAKLNESAAAADVRGGKAWDVSCRGWDVKLGTLYAYDYKGERNIAAGGLWAQSLKTANCGAPKAAGVAGLPSVAVANCQQGTPPLAYVAYSGAMHGKAVAADGYAPIADVLETGLKVIAGTAQPPKATETVAAASSGVAGSDAGLGSLAEELGSAEKRKEAAYLLNLQWRFADAGAGFQSIAEDTKQPTSVRAEAYLNWGLNASNQGRFKLAKALFNQGDQLAVGNPSLAALSKSYRALDDRNQGQFQAAADEAEAARFAFEQLASGKDPRTGVDLGAAPAGEVDISAVTADALLPRTSYYSLSDISLADRIGLQVAQADLTAATSLSALGDNADARTRLEEAKTVVHRPELAGVAAWLRALIDSESAKLDIVEGHADTGRAALFAALQEARANQSEAGLQAFLLMAVAKSDVALGHTDAAMSEYREGIDLFRESRGSLEASGNQIGDYLDLLLRQMQANPSQAGDLKGEFYFALQSLGGAQTAQTVAQLSGRLGQTGAAAGLIRSLEDTQRQVRIKESEIAHLQAESAPPAAVTASENELAGLQKDVGDLEQKVLSVAPKYGQMVATDVSLDDLRAALKPGELYVKVVLLSTAGYGFAVSPDGATPYRTDLTRASAAATVEKLRAPFEAQNALPRYDVERSHQFFEALFGPIRDKVLSATHIIYEPDQTILSLPIVALATDQASVDLINGRVAQIRAAGHGSLSYVGVHWLGRKAETSLVESTASFVQARAFPPSAATHAYLGLGDPVQPAAGDPQAYKSLTEWGAAGNADPEICQDTRAALLDLHPLAGAETELASVGKSVGDGDVAILSQASFTNGALASRPDLNQYRVVYFATHGLLPVPGGCLPEPSLLTSVGDGGDGLLSLGKILNLKLDADLVVLAACDTASNAQGIDTDLSGLGGSSESLGGLTRAFIYAGARSLIVSHWQVDSAATVQFMSDAFKAHAASQAGALHAAQLRLMNQDSYSHPYYWAMFSLVGDGARPMPAQ